MQPPHLALPTDGVLLDGAQDGVGGVQQVVAQEDLHPVIQQVGHLHGHVLPRPALLPLHLVAQLLKLLHLRPAEVRGLVRCKEKYSEVSSCMFLTIWTEQHANQVTPPMHAQPRHTQPMLTSLYTYP